MAGVVIWIVGAALLLWFCAIQSGEKDDAFATQRLAEIGRSMFDGRSQPSFRDFARAAETACRSAGVGPVAAYYGMRMMAAHGGVTPARVAILAQS